MVVPSMMSAHRRRGGRFVWPALVVISMGLVWVLGLRGSGPLSAKQRQDLERQAGELDKQHDIRYRAGQYEKAAKDAKQALALRRQLYPSSEYPDGHADLAGSLSAVGSILTLQGVYPAARSYLEQALAMRRRLFPAGHPDLARSLNNLGFLLEKQGEYDEALAHYEEALALRQKFYPKEKFPRGHPELATTLNNLAALLEVLGKPAEARTRYEEALAMAEDLFPKKEFHDGHEDLAGTLNNLGALLANQAGGRGARGYLERALDMYRKLYPKKDYPRGHPDLARCLNNLGFLSEVLGKYSEAQSYYGQARTMTRDLFPEKEYPQGHPDLASAWNNTGFVLLAQGKFDKARSAFASGLTIYQDLADVFTAAASEAEALNFADQLPSTRDGLLSAARHLSGSDEDSYTAVWHTKAAILRALQRRLALPVKGARAEKLREQLDDTRRRLSRLLLAGPVGPEHGQQVRDATRKKEALQRQLARSSPEAKRQAKLQRGAPADLIRNLPAGTVFIDLVRYVRFEQDPKVPRLAGERRTPWYAAFVLRRGAATARVELGPADTINQTVTAWLDAIIGGRDDGEPDGPFAEELRRRVWEPLAPHVPAGTDTLVIAPDDRLTRLPWVALPCATGGPVLLERYALAVVPHGPFLLDRLTAAARPDAKKGLLLAVGGVDYFAQPRAAGASPGQPPSAALDAPRCRAGYWEELPESGPEVTKAVELARPRTPVVRRGDEASTEQLLLDLPAARWAVLATHAFYANARFRSAFRLGEHAFGREQSGERVAAGARNPFALCGLVLAGANRPVVRNAVGVPLGDGGLITADLIAALPLGQLDLVVLSACESGLGELVQGEGAFSLQQAFHLAGSRNVVSALWKVDDGVTAALMGLFHYKLWREGKSPLAALREAQLYVYHHKERVGDLAFPWGPDFEASANAAKWGKGAEGERSPILWWAGFSLSGPGSS